LLCHTDFKEGTNPQSKRFLSFFSSLKVYAPLPGAEKKWKTENVRLTDITTAVTKIANEPVLFTVDIITCIFDRNLLTWSFTRDLTNQSINSVGNSEAVATFVLAQLSPSVNSSESPCSGKYSKLMLLGPVQSNIIAGARASLKSVMFFTHLLQSMFPDVVFRSVSCVPTVHSSFLGGQQAVILNILGSFRYVDWPAVFFGARNESYLGLVIGSKSEFHTTVKDVADSVTFRGPVLAACIINALQTDSGWAASGGTCNVLMFRKGRLKSGASLKVRYISVDAINTVISAVERGSSSAVGSGPVVPGLHAELLPCGILHNSRSHLFNKLSLSYANQKMLQGFQNSKGESCGNNQFDLFIAADQPLDDATVKDLLSANLSVTFECRNQLPALRDRPAWSAVGKRVGCALSLSQELMLLQGPAATADQSRRFYLADLAVALNQLQDCIRQETLALISVSRNGSSKGTSEDDDMGWRSIIDLLFSFLLAVRSTTLDIAVKASGKDSKGKNLGCFIVQRDTVIPSDPNNKEKPPDVIPLWLTDVEDRRIYAFLMLRSILCTLGATMKGDRASSHYNLIQVIAEQVGCVVRMDKPAYSEEWDTFQTSVENGSLEFRAAGKRLTEIMRKFDTLSKNRLRFIKHQSAFRALFSVRLRQISNFGRLSARCLSVPAVISFPCVTDKSPGCRGKDTSAVHVLLDYMGHRDALPGPRETCDVVLTRCVL
jgi:hypothetical protein